jgi:uncharacterized protein YdaU (DUF1376 family)
VTRLPVMPLWVKDLLVDTEQLTCAEFGAYMRLLCMMWLRDGSVPDEDGDIARMLHMEPRRWGRTKVRLLPYLLFRDDGNITQKRLDQIRQKSVHRDRIKSSSKEGGQSSKTNGLDTLSRARDLNLNHNKDSNSTLDVSAAMAPSPAIGGRSGATPSTNPETISAEEAEIIRSRLKH